MVDESGANVGFDKDVGLVECENADGTRGVVSHTGKLAKFTVAGWDLAVILVHDINSGIPKTFRASIISKSAPYFQYFNEWCSRKRSDGGKLSQERTIVRYYPLVLQNSRTVEQNEANGRVCV